MAAVVVLADDRDPLRDDLDKCVPGGWWHTTDQLRTTEGQDQTHTLLQTFQAPDETCVIVDKTTIDDADKDGEIARETALGRLLTEVHQATHGLHPKVNLAVIEERRENSKNNRDRRVRSTLVQQGTIGSSFQLASVSPGSEHLLWLPDLVCSAYRQKMLFHRTGYFSEIEDLTRVLELQ